MEPGLPAAVSSMHVYTTPSACPQDLDSRSLSWSPLSRSVFLALKQLIAGLIQNCIPCSVVIAHAYVSGVTFEMEGGWAIPKYERMDQWNEPGLDAVAGIERLLLAHGVTVVRGVPAPSVEHRLSALENAPALEQPFAAWLAFRR